MKLKKLAVATILLLNSPLTQAVSFIFSDNFDNYAPDQLDWAPPASSGWTVTGGTVDLHGVGGLYDFIPDNGSYVDLDGSTLSSGLFSNNVTLLSNTTYTLSFDLAGSHRGNRGDTVNVNFGSTAASYILNNTDPFSTFTLNFTPSSDGLYSFSFRNMGGDNRGAFLDNVFVSTLPEPASAIPEPGTCAMLLAGLGIMGFVLHGRKPL